MLERARQLTEAERLDNVTFELGDAQVRRFDPARFDLVISRFGTMFFSDPVAAFANIASALGPRGRLVLLVWQRLELNQWAMAIDAAVGEAAEVSPPGVDPSRSATQKPPRPSSSAPGSRAAIRGRPRSRSSTGTT